MTASHARAISWSTFIFITGAALSGCGDGDTVLALNVTLRKSAQTARTLAVNITQPGQSGLDTTVTIATKETDAGLVAANNTFFERITLPASYTDSLASVTVVAKDPAGADVGTATAMVEVRPAEAVAGFVTLGEDPPPPPAEEAAAAAP
jgi:hypothetical protein